MCERDGAPKCATQVDSQVDSELWMMTQCGLIDGAGKTVAPLNWDGPNLPVAPGWSSWPRFMRHDDCWEKPKVEPKISKSQNASETFGRPRNSCCILIALRLSGNYIKLKTKVDFELSDYGRGSPQQKSNAQEESEKERRKLPKKRKKTQEKRLVSYIRLAKCGIITHNYHNSTKYLCGRLHQPNLHH